jgi:EAL domain-containing protein (putative c-di-GMP-specific phosphodiesterase class I)
VNLSARHLRDPAFAEELLRAIHLHDTDPSRLELEITETALMSDPQKALAVIRVLTQAGVRIAIDDFGTGFSSLAYLKHLDLDTLKIDRCLVKDITNNANDLTIVRSTLRMAHSLDLSWWRKASRSVRTTRRCENSVAISARVFGIAKPMPANKVLAVVRRMGSGSRICSNHR